jgi:hypothetical protein
VSEEDGSENVTRRSGKQRGNNASPGTIQPGWSFRRAMPACILT